MTQQVHRFHQVGIISIYDFFMYVQQCVSQKQDRHMTIDKRTLYRLLRRLEPRAYFDFDRLKGEKIIRFEEDLIKVVVPKSVQWRTISCAYNVGLDDSMAFREAQRQSRRSSSLPRVIKTTKDRQLPSPPPELCCPISLELLEDPVETLRGYTYSRRSIETWFEAGNMTDPIDGSQMKLMVLTPNNDIRLKVEKYMSAYSP